MEKHFDKIPEVSAGWFTPRITFGYLLGKDAKWSNSKWWNFSTSCIPLREINSSHFREGSSTPVSKVFYLCCSTWSSCRCFCSLQRRWTIWPLKVPPNSKNSMIPLSIEVEDSRRFFFRVCFVHHRGRVDLLHWSFPTEDTEIYELEEHLGLEQKKKGLSEIDAGLWLKIRRRKKEGRWE